MQTQTWILAQTIHDDRIRGYADRSRQHRFKAVVTTSRTEQVRSLFGRAFGTAAGPVAASARS